VTSIDYKAMFWQYFTEDYKVLFQGNFANNNAHSWRDI